jgi:RNA polymerase sigma factor (sigma-70 family)
MVVRLKSAPLAEDLTTLFDFGALGSLSDTELLARFVRKDDASSSEAAFAILVARHGPMVLGVCRRMVGDEHWAADTYQAVFLILARKARSVWVHDSLGRWLYGVSVRVARRARVMARTERKRVQPLDALEPAARDDRLGACELAEIRSVIDEEISRLPARYRVPVVLCYLEGMTGEQAARRLKCPLGTLESRLHRARERLRASLTRRGLAPTASAIAGLASATARAEVPRGLAEAACAAAVSLVRERAITGTVAGIVVRLANGFVWRDLMLKGCSSGLLMVTMIGLSVPGIKEVSGSGDEKEARKTGSAVRTWGTTVKAEIIQNTRAGQFRKICAEYEERRDAMTKAITKVHRQSEINRVYQETSPDEAGFCQRMLELAAASPKDAVARDALVWIIDKPHMMDRGAYGEVFAHAAALLVRHHGDDPDAVRVGLGLDNVVSPHRIALLTGLCASAKCREAKGLARLALAQYLRVESMFVAGALQKPGRQKVRYFGFVDDNGKSYEKEVEQSDEEYSYVIQLRLRNPDIMRTESERLYQEVITDYGDVPYRTDKDRELEALAKEPLPRWNGKLLTDDERRQLAEIVARKRTLGEVADEQLDDLHNLVAGKPAPEIEGVDMTGKPLKLSDYRGKVVVLVFWGSWCGPCMREVPHERELAERFKDNPFAVLGINCDRDKAAALEAIRSAGITWANWNDGDPGEGPIAKRYHISSYPTVFVVDAQGIIRQKKILGKAIDQAVEELLRELERTPHSAKE